jgi:magnesium chelatase accessory protein
VTQAPARVPPDWPHREASRSVRTGSVDWHVQVAGRGPVVLLLHGSGASAHSWADVLPLLAEKATVVAPDLPGHGYTTGWALGELTLPRVAAQLGELLAALKLPAPTVVAGHSAGAALALRLALDAPQPPRAVIGFNPSLVAPPAAYMQFVAPLVNPVATSGPLAWLLANVAPNLGMVDRLLDSTRSTLPAEQRSRYRTLFAMPAHVQGTLGFMAAADLPRLLQDADALKTQPLLVVAGDDDWVPQAQLMPVIRRWLPRADVRTWSGGHLVHEAFPRDAAALVLQALGRI